MRRIHTWFAIVVLLGATSLVHAQMPPASQPATRPTRTQAELEADFARMLSNATLEGSYISTGAGRDPTRLSTDHYTLGTVRKLAGNTWLINARLGYGGNTMNIPLPLPIEWAGDTPVIVVDNVTMMGMGPYTARVMFFDGHYSGYWKHGDRGGILFGVIRSPAAATTRPAGQ